MLAIRTLVNGCEAINTIAALGLVTLLSSAHIGAKGTPGHVYIVMRNLENITNLEPGYSKADFDFDLHGDVAEGDLFPPETSTEITLTEYKLWAGIGGREKILCNSDGRPDLLPEIKLVITRQ